MAELRWGLSTHEGQLRTQNEDHAHAHDALFVVADGMGGHLAGEIASQMAVDTMREQLPEDAATSLDDLVESIVDANTGIFDDANNDPDRSGMGTTVTAIAVVSDPLDGEVFGIANVGDSRAYVLRHGRLRQLTIDHSFVQELVAEGAITRDEARTHPRRNIVTRALGIEPHVRVDSWTMPIIRSDRLVLCSDGLVDEITDDAITEILHHHDDPQAAAQALVDAANDAGGRDNITVIVVDVDAGDDPPDPTEEFDVIPLWSDDDLDATGEAEIVADPTDAELAELADATPGGTPLPVDVAPDTTTDAEVAAASAGEPDADVPEGRPRKRVAGLVKFFLIIGVAAVIILGFTLLAAWARSGYFVAFNDSGQVVIYQGRQDGFLWFDPTAEATGAFTRDELDDDSVALVDAQPEFSTEASAKLFVAERLQPIDADDDSEP